MKKIVVGVGLFLILGVSYFLLSYGWVSPAKNITGCYTAVLNKGKIKTRDVICLRDTGQYKQFIHVEKDANKEYNQALWKQFSYTVGDEQHMAGTLNDFIIVNSKGLETATMALDIQIDIGMSGNNSFVVGSKYAGERRVYTQEKSN